MVPKYFNDLHLAISAITGVPRIASFKEGQTQTDKYKDIPEAEWEAALTNFFGMFKEGKKYAQFYDDGTFIIGGKLEPKELAKYLKSVVKELEK